MSADTLPGSVTAWESAWADALHDLEIDVEVAEGLLRSAHLPSVNDVQLVAWRPPSGLGPLPASLLARAQALLSRQIEVARLAGEAASLSRRHLAAADAMRARPAAVPMYLDANG